MVGRPGHGFPVHEFEASAACSDKVFEHVGFGRPESVWKEIESSKDGRDDPINRRRVAKENSGISPQEIYQLDEDESLGGGKWTHGRAVRCKTEKGVRRCLRARTGRRASGVAGAESLTGVESGAGVRYGALSAGRPTSRAD